MIKNYNDDEESFRYATVAYSTLLVETAVLGTDLGLIYIVNTIVQLISEG